jgi:vacuolar-type H+-ATPase subunit F/Vma7
MKRSVRIVCRSQLAPGFALAGLQIDEAPTAAAGAARIAALAKDPAVGLLLVDEACWAALPESERRALVRKPLPLIVPFPGPAWAPGPPAAEAHLAEILRQALGYRVRLR